MPSVMVLSETYYRLTTCFNVKQNKQTGGKTTDCLKNHLTKHKHVGTHSDAFVILITNMNMKFSNIDLKNEDMVL